MSRGRRSHSASWDLPPPNTAVFSVEEELRKNPKLRQEDISALGLWIREAGLPKTSDVQLVKFLHSCDYVVEDAKSCAKVFYSCRADFLELFCGFNIQTPSILSILNVMSVAILPCTTPENYRIVYNGLKTSDTKNFIFQDICKVLIMTIESIFLTEPTISGIVFMLDMELSSMMHFLKFGFTLPKMIARYTQGGMPLKQEGVHLLKCSGFIDKALKMIRCYGSKKDWEKVYVHHGNDLSALHARVPRHCLPSDFGGSLPSVQELEVT